MIPTLTNVVDFPFGSDLSKRVQAKRAHIRKSARKRGIKFNLSRTYIAYLLLKEKCHYTGVRFKESGHDMRTFDRVDNNKGYFDKNVVACTYKINSIKEILLECKSSDKNRLTQEQLVQFVYTLTTGEPA